MSIDMLFVDEKATLTQASVSANRQLRFRDRLREGSVYTLTGFDVVRSSPNFRLCDAPHSIRFNDSTSLQQVPASLKPIPEEVFNFMPHSQLLELANTGKQLPDIMGEVNAIRSTITDHIQGAQRVMLTLRLHSGEDVCVGLFDTMALAFHAKLDSYGKEPRIAIVTSVNPKIVGGCLYLNATSATHLYFDDETSAGTEVVLSLPGQEAGDTVSPSKVVHAQKIEPLTISELNEYIITAEPQVVEFLCTAEVTAIQQDEGWCYIGCSRCSKKLVQEISSFTCVRCNQTNALAALKYRVKISVTDNTDTASFIGFDTEMAKLTNVNASESAAIVGVGVDARVETGVPLALAAIVGKTYTFQLKLEDFNFSSKHQTFTISRIFAERKLPPMPTFVAGASNPNDAVAEGVPPEVGTVIGITGNTAHEPSTSDSSSGKRPSSVGISIDAHLAAPKKTLVE